MARDKHIDRSPRFLPVDLAAQLLPGTFEHAAHHLLRGVVDLSRFDARFRNDDTGAPAYPPAMLLTVVLCAYAHGIVSSRAIERLCREHVTFIALCGDTAPHFTTIAQFVSTLGPDIAHVFAAVLAIGDQQGLIGREMFAIDGVQTARSCRVTPASAAAARGPTSSGRRPSARRRHRPWWRGTGRRMRAPSNPTWRPRTRPVGNGSARDTRARCRRAPHVARRASRGPPWPIGRCPAEQPHR